MVMRRLFRLMAISSHSIAAQSMMRNRRRLSRWMMMGTPMRVEPQIRPVLIALNGSQGGTERLLYFRLDAR